MRVLVSASQAQPTPYTPSVVPSEGYTCQVGPPRHLLQGRVQINGGEGKILRWGPVMCNDVDEG